MRHRLKAILLSVLTLAGSTAWAEDSVLTGATVIDGTGGPALSNATIVISGGRIACIGAAEACEIPEGATLTDLSGKWVMPGIIDAHVHFSQTAWFDGRPDTFDVRDKFPYEAVAARQKTDPDRYYRAFLCSGVTGVYDVGGFPWTWDLRGPAENNPMAPHVAAAGPLVSHGAREILNTAGEKQMIALPDAETGRQAVRYMAAFGSDAVKVWFLPVQGEPRQAEIDPRVKAIADEAGKQEIPLIVHSTSLREAKIAVKAGAHLLVHSVWDQPVDDEFLADAKAAGTIYTPTLVVRIGYTRMFERVLGLSDWQIDDANACVDPKTADVMMSGQYFVGHPSAARLTADQIAAGRAALEENETLAGENLRRVHAAGIPIAMGTDAGNPGTVHGPSIYEEMEMMQAAGLTATDIIVAATRNGAMAMGRADDIGTLETGKIADLIVLNADPSADISNMRSIGLVMRAGVMHRISNLSQGER